MLRSAMPAHAAGTCTAHLYIDVPICKKTVRCEYTGFHSLASKRGLYMFRRLVVPAELFLQTIS